MSRYRFRFLHFHRCLPVGCLCTCAFILSRISLLWSVSAGVPGCRCVCLCAHLCLRRDLHLSVPLCASAHVCCEMSLCTQQNHPLLIRKFSGISNSVSTWSPMGCCCSRPSCYADELNPVYWLEEQEQLGWAGCG